MRVLLIDDEVVALKALQENVDWVSYDFTEIFTAQDAEQARLLLEKHPIDLILCDIEMPGENGLELIRYVRETWPETECIMITCHADFGYIKRAMKFRVWDYILKPIDYEELEELLVQFHHRKQAERKKENLGKIVDKVQESRGRILDCPEERLDVVKSYINDHLHEKIYVEDLANLIPLNAQHFMRVFKRYTGQSVTEYITERRIITASNLLKDTEYPINFIADCVGCENFSYFTKMFKRYSGLTPKEYRNRFKGKI